MKTLDRVLFVLSLPVVVPLMLLALGIAAVAETLNRWREEFHGR